MKELDLDEKLRLIQEAVEAGKSDPKKEEQMLAEIVDPADETACDGCQ